jgi:hypothetical protein
MTGTNNPHPLYYTQTLSAYELGLEKTVEVNDKQYNSLVFQNLVPFSGVKYIIAKIEDT